MDKDIESQIKNYNENSVSHVEGLQHMFINASMYLGSVANPQHTAEEAIMNAIDEVSIGVAKNIWVTYHDDGSISVKDDGRGMPPMYSKKFKMPTARALLTIPETGKSFENNNAGSSQHGIGMKATTATSDWLEVKIWRDGTVYFDKYELQGNKPGIPVYDLVKNDRKEISLPYKKALKNDIEHGTEVRWLPSDKVWDSISFDWDDLKELLHQLAYLNKGLSVHLTNEFDDEEITYSENNGLESYIEALAKNNEGTPITPAFSFSGVFDTKEKLVNKLTNEQTELVISADVSLIWTNGTLSKEYLFTNNVPNPLGGTPIKGFKNGIARLINKYAKDLGMAKDTIERRDIMPGLFVVINMTHPAPQFDGQTKKSITSSNAVGALNTITYNDAQLTFDRSVDSIKNVIKQAMERADKRKKEETSKINLKSKEITTRLSKKISPAKKTGMDSELFIVEGDSAAGTLISERDTDFQAIMPIRGKIINTYKASIDKSLANVELSTIFAALGAGIGKTFNESNLNYGKIMIATDMDPDGAQIADLLLTVMAKFAPDLILNGHVYRVLSPLFVNTLKNKTEHYTYTQAEQDAYLKAKNHSVVVDVARNKGLGELEPEQVQQTMINPETRKVIQYKIGDIEEAFNVIERFMGTDSSQRREIFFNEDLYQNIEAEE